MPTILILGGTGKTGRRVVERLRAAGETNVRAAARQGADVRFDWDDPATHDAALEGVDRVYLIPPTLRVDYGEQVPAFIERARDAGVRHITLLSARGVDEAPPESALRASELALIGSGLSYAILRPTWFMQNLSEGVWAPAVRSGTLALPAGDGAEAFIDVEDIAAAAVATLRDPAAHAGAEYALAGPEAITHAEAAEHIAAATGRAVSYVDADRAEWIAASVAAGLPRDYAEMLAFLMDGIRSGDGSVPTDAVLRATGREPGSFAAFAQREAAAGAWAEPALA